MVLFLCVNNQIYSYFKKEQNVLVQKLGTKRVAVTISERWGQEKPGSSYFLLRIFHRKFTDVAQ